MKRIRILTEGASELILLDDSDENINEYTKKLSSIFESSNVTILETSLSSLIVRPSKLVSMEITEHIIEGNGVEIVDQEDMVTD